MFPAEEIPDPESIFVRVHRGKLNGDSIEPSAFEEHGGGMSANWERYSAAEETREQIKDYPTKSGKVRNPADYAVISLVAGAVRAIGGTSVQHTPRDYNRAHTDVHGPGPGAKPQASNDGVEHTRIRLKMAQLATLILAPSS